MGEIKCEICNKSFKTQESLNQHFQMSHSNEKKAKTNIKKYFIFSALIIAAILISYTFYVRAQNPGKYDDFAQCLTEKGAIIYGNDYCQYTAKQLNFFGKSEKYLSYVRCSENEQLCDEKGITTTPTWEIKENMYSGVQTFEKLSAITGCEI